MNDELGPEARDLIERACREARGPEAHELRRIRRNVLFGVAPAAVLFGAGEAAAASAKLSIVSIVGLAAKGALLGTGVALAGYAVQRIEVPPGPPAVVAPPAARPAPPTPQLASTEAPASGDSKVLVPPAALPAQSPLVEKSPSSTASRPEPGGALPSATEFPASAELLEEVENLRRVQDHLRAGRGDEALRILDASSSRLGQGQMRQERLAAEVFAACQSGQTGRARDAARRFLRENPATPSAARLSTSCVGEELELP